MIRALETEARALSAGLAGLSDEEWHLPTRCTPWTVRDLLGHVSLTLSRIPQVLDEPVPDGPAITALDYYRPDERFSDDANAARIAMAAQGATTLDGFNAEWSRAVAAAATESGERLVRTRHGDVMPLAEFLVTRVVELAVHGLDLADATGREPWLTPESATVLQDLMLGPGRTAPDPLHFIRAATGRADDPALLERLQPRLPTLG